MLLSRTLLAGASLLAMASTAYAADLIIDEAPAPYVETSAGYDWTGLYVGVFAGAASGTVDWTSQYSDEALGDSPEGSLDVEGWLGGLTVGANFQTGMFVLGVEGDIAWTDISGEGDIVDSSSIASLNVDYLGTIRARAGVAFDSVLLYATGGFAYGAGSVGITELDGVIDANEDATFTGYAVGLGAEVAVTENISIKGEYLYTALTSDDVDFSMDDYDIDGDLVVNGDVDAHTFKVGLNYSF